MKGEEDELQQNERHEGRERGRIKAREMKSQIISLFKGKQSITERLHVHCVVYYHRTPIDTVRIKSMGTPVKLMKG